MCTESPSQVRLLVLLCRWAGHGLCTGFMFHSARAVGHAVQAPVHADGVPCGTGWGLI